MFIWDLSPHKGSLNQLKKTLYRGNYAANTRQEKRWITQRVDCRGPVRAAEYF